MVTNLDDSGPGSLRDAVGSEQRWVCFEEGLEGTIELGSTLRVSSNVVLDGRGAHITLRADSGTRIVTLQSVDNVIVTNFELEGGEDGVFVRNGSSDIWLDHLSSGRARDEVFAITGAGDSASDRPDRITVSFTRVVGAGKVMLLGSTTTAENNAPDRVTLHHNYWSESVERHPLVRFARVHAFNNWIHHWGSEGTGQGVRVGADAQFYSEANIYEDRWGNPALVPENLGTFGFVDSVNDLVVGDPRFEERMPDRVFDPAGEYPYTAEEPGDALRARLQAEAGWQP